MGNNFYGAVGLTGGSSGYLDAIDGANLNDKDGCIVITDTYVYTYSLDADSTSAEDSPYIIAPDTNPDNKRWVLVSRSHITEDLEDLTNREEIAKHYLRLNQSFVNMYFDDFVSTSKTGGSYTSKVDTNTYKMTPGNAGTWRSAMWTASQSSTVCKLVWRTEAGFDHDIKISADNGANWTTISSGGATTNLDQEVNIANAGTQIILEVSGGTQGALLDYILIVK